MQKILVLRGGALGDFIVTLPALALLRQRWPQSRIELVGNSVAAQLALSRRSASAFTPAPFPTNCHLLDDSTENVRGASQTKCHLIDDTLVGDEGGLANGGAGKLVDAVHSQHEAQWSALYASTPVLGAFGEWLSRFDLVLNFWPDPDGTLREKFPRHPRQIFLSAEALPNCAPAAAHYCAPLRELGLEAQEYFYRVEVARFVPSAEKFANEAKRSVRRMRDNSPYLAIHPGSGSAAKNWPIERWVALCEWLKAEQRVELLIVTGEADSRAGDLLARFGSCARNLPLLELAAKLSACRLFLGHDSGVSHLAAACGAPSVLLFGPTDPAVWAPSAPHVSVVKRGPTLNSISIADVQAAVLAALTGGS